MGKLSPTYQQRLFNDEELGLPSHDSIVRWADKFIRQRPAAILDLLGLPYSYGPDETPMGWRFLERPDMRFSGSSWDEESWPLCEAAQRLGQSLAPAAPIPPEMRLEAPTWEPILSTKGGAVAGALDLMTQLTHRTLILVIPVERSRLYGSRFEAVQRAFRDEPNRILASDGMRMWDARAPGADLPCTPDLLPALGPAVIGRSMICRVGPVAWEEVDSAVIPIAFEAKTQIRAAGQLIRQLQTYRTKLPKQAKIIVVAPSSEFRGEMRDILVEQGFFVLPYLSNI